MTLFSLNHLVREAERTLDQRRSTYPRIVHEGSMTERTAELRLDQMQAIGDALAALMLDHPDAAVAVQSKVAAKQAAREAARNVGACA